MSVAWSAVTTMSVNAIIRVGSKNTKAQLVLASVSFVVFIFLSSQYLGTWKQGEIDIVL